MTVVFGEHGKLKKCLLLASAVVLTLFSKTAFATETGQKTKHFSLWTVKKPLRKATLTVHFPRHRNGTAIVICPGGGYGGLALEPEGHGIARWLHRHGITGVVLDYELPRGRAMIPLHDVQRAIRTVRANSKIWNLNAKRIGVMGFSAGGHLASTAGTHFDRGDRKATDPIDRASCRPDFMILIYPVITMGKKTHRGSKRNLLGKKPTKKLVKFFSNELQVTKETPPAFLAHAQDDKAVTPENSLMFFNALKSKNIATKYLKLPYGGHGLNRYHGPMWDAWQTSSLQWLISQKLIPKSSAKVKN